MLPNNFSDGVAFNSVTELRSKHVFYSLEYIIKNTYLKEYIYILNMFSFGLKSLGFRLHAPQISVTMWKESILVSFKLDICLECFVAMLSLKSIWL